MNCKELQDFIKKLEQELSQDKMDKFMEDCCKEIAARLLSRAIKRTPVDEGTLRRGWTAGKENMSEKGSIVGVSGKTGYASQINVVKRGGEYRCAVYNSTSYSSYVEFGHRTPKHDGWVPGQFFLTISEKEVNDLAPALLEKRLMEYLKEAMK